MLVGGHSKVHSLRAEAQSSAGILLEAIDTSEVSQFFQHLVLKTRFCKQTYSSVISSGLTKTVGQERFLGERLVVQ
ncbi:hypothetical protein D3C80_1279230 [compost metagenome]